MRVSHESWHHTADNHWCNTYWEDTRGEGISIAAIEAVQTGSDMQKTDWKGCQKESGGMGIIHPSPQITKGSTQGWIRVDCSYSATLWLFVKEKDSRKEGPYAS
jgi:hypothetical protein